MQIKTCFNALLVVSCNSLLPIWPSRHGPFAIGNTCFKKF